jgi:hypothetical protein
MRTEFLWEEQVLKTVTSNTEEMSDTIKTDVKEIICFLRKEDG